MSLPGPHAATVSIREWVSGIAISAAPPGILSWKSDKTGERFRYLAIADGKLRTAVSRILPPAVENGAIAERIAGTHPPTAINCAPSGPHRVPNPGQCHHHNVDEAEALIRQGGISVRDQPRLGQAA
jgi:hypothetical protein